MTDNTTPAVSNENAVAAEAQPNFVLTRSYLKDLSLELPHAPQIFLENGDPATDMDLSVTYQMLDTGFYEVAVKVTVKTEINGKTLFLVEGTQGGIFRVDHIPLDQIEPLMRIMGAGIVRSEERRVGKECIAWWI